MSNRELSRLVGLFGCMAALGGCAPSLQGNAPRDARQDMPDGFDRSTVGPGGAEATPVASAKAKSSKAQRPGVGEKKWNEFFSDPHLKKLIEAALSNNQELNIVLQEVILAENEVRARKGEYVPRLNAQAGAGVEKVGEHTSQGVSDGAHGVPEHLGDFKFGLSASWEIDVWKKLRNASKAAALRYLSSVAGKNFVVTRLVSEIADAYYELLALDRQIEVLKRNIEIQQDALTVVRFEKQAARVTQLAVQRFEAEVLKNRSRGFSLEQRRVEAENKINFLVGRYPQHVERDVRAFDAPLPEQVIAGVPSTLLDNRPDVKQAELEMAAAQLDVKVAKAAFLPALSIEAGVGYESFNIKHLVATPQSLIYNFAGNLTAPLLNRAAIKALYRSANARQIQAVYQYEKALLSAFADVANELSRLENLKRGYELEAKQVEKLTESIHVSNILFQSARADYMEVLLTRRDSLDAEMELIETKKRQLQALVHVYQALGGGWR